MRVVQGHGSGAVTSPADRSGTLDRLLAGALCILVSMTLALTMAACTTATETVSDGTEVTDETTEAEARPADPAGTVSVRDAVESESPASQDDAADGTLDEAAGESGEAASDGTGEGERASGVLIYTNDCFGFAAELPADYTEKEPDLVTETKDTVVLSAGDAKGDACLILAHTLPAEGEVSDGDGESTEAEDAYDNDHAGKDDADAVGDEESADDADEAAETVFDPIDEWARTYAAWVIAALEDDGATITRSEIGRATLGGASCVIVEIEFEPRDGASEGEVGGAQRDLFFFDGRSDTSSVGLCIDCSALSKEALDTLENTFVAK